MARTRRAIRLGRPSALTPWYHTGTSAVLVWYQCGTTLVRHPEIVARHKGRPVPSPESEATNIAPPLDGALRRERPLRSAAHCSRPVRRPKRWTNEA
jgi:hypothetical protein